MRVQLSSSCIDRTGKLFRACLVGFAAVLVGVAPAWSQKGEAKFLDNPGTLGKVQTLHWDAMPKWATIDVQVRGRTENQTSTNYLSGNDQLYELTRIYGGLEVRPAHWMTAYAQFIDTHAPGIPAKYAAPTMRNTFDARQAYVDLHFAGVKVIAGRQELRYGSERLVGISDWNNNSRTWDGFLGRIGDKNRLDLFSTSVVGVHPSSLDKHGAGLTFHGAVGTIGTWVPHVVVQPFIFVKAFPRVQSPQGIFGTQTTVTPGAEVTGTLPGGLYVDLLGALQRGSYANDSIHAGAGYAKVGYTAQRVHWKPRLVGEYDYASGNSRRDLQRFGTFDQQYPTNHNAFGLVDLIGFQNVEQERINLDVKAAKRVAMVFQQEWLQVATRQDSVYNAAAGVAVKVPVAGFKSSDIGREFDASGKWLINPCVVINAGVGHFSPGTLMRGNSHGAPLTIAYLSLTYRLKVTRTEAP